jgi:hypothetical protein
MNSTLMCYRFINIEDIDFSDAQNMQPVQVCNEIPLFICAISRCFGINEMLFYQEWELAENLQGALEYQTRYSLYFLVLLVHLGVARNYVCFVELYFSIFNIFEF